MMPDYYNDPFGRKKEDETSTLLKVVYKEDLNELQQHIHSMMVLTSSFEDVAKILAKVMLRFREDELAAYSTYRNALDMVVLQVENQRKVDKAGVMSLLRWMAAATDEALHLDKPF
jgi:hypothetical protein